VKKSELKWMPSAKHSVPSADPSAVVPERVAHVKVAFVMAVPAMAADVAIFVMAADAVTTQKQLQQKMENKNGWIT
jgi:hypothetical protein